MPTPTYTPLANITLASSAASITFSSINQSYKDYVVIACVQDTNASIMNIRPNGDTVATRSIVFMAGSGSTASSGTSATLRTNYLGNSSTAMTQYSFHFMDATATDKHKTILFRQDRSDAGTAAYVGKWDSTTAISSIVFIPTAGSFVTGSTFALYGIAA